MRFRPNRVEEPEINLIPFIDVLLVILIFLMLSTTYNRLTELQIQLPYADQQASPARERELLLGVDAQGRYSLQGQLLSVDNATTLAQALRASAQNQAGQVVLVMHADAAARHQSVITALEAARAAGLGHITFATQSGAPPNLNR